MIRSPRLGLLKLASNFGARRQTASPSQFSGSCHAVHDEHQVAAKLLVVLEVLREVVYPEACTIMD